MTQKKTKRSDELIDELLAGRTRGQAIRSGNSFICSKTSVGMLGKKVKIDLVSA